MKKKLRGKQTEQLSLEKGKIIQVPDVDFLKSLLSGKFKRLLYLFKKAVLYKKYMWEGNEEKKESQKNMHMMIKLRQAHWIE